MDKKELKKLFISQFDNIAFPCFDMEEAGVYYFFLDEEKDKIICGTLFNAGISHDIVIDIEDYNITIYSVLEYLYELLNEYIFDIS